ncbi:MAG: HlyD family secretion protein [Gemmataceae bacterium]|nr:HlyD family secretion protein [Gemmataceae bacterium]
MLHHPIERYSTVLGPNLPSLQLARTPRMARRLANLVVLALVGLPFLLLGVTWTQSVHGMGRAIAFNPVQRPQFIVSPIEGRVKKWFVVEGDRVKAGQRIVEMVDNDPNLELRLLDEERAILDRLRAAEARVLDIEARIRNLEDSRRLAIDVQTSILRQEQARVQAAEQELLEAKAALEAAEPNYRRQKELFENKLGGLASQRDVELAKQALDTAIAKHRAAEARVKLAKAGEAATRDNLSKIDADTKAMINLELAHRRSAEADVANIRREKAQIEVRIARQRAQYVDAPTDGVVFRLLANAEQGGILVRPGERLAILVPDINPALTPSDHPGIVVELQIDGNDLPLVRKGDPVRLQFEGWPAVQFVGWPSVAVGTFGGRVYLVDPTANDKGQFRILVEPDPNDEPWPDQDYLRQGVRAQGWVLLSEVTVGWELWRQLNGFPPVRELHPKNKSRILGPVAK